MTLKDSNKYGNEILMARGGYLGGAVPPKFEVGGTAHALVQYFEK